MVNNHKDSLMLDQDCKADLSYFGNTQVNISHIILEQNLSANFCYHILRAEVLHSAVVWAGPSTIGKAAFAERTKPLFQTVGPTLPANDQQRKQV